MKILLAQKDLKRENRIKREIARRGWEFITCERGDEAFQVLTSANPPCIAVIDDDLPEMDGKEICRRVRKKGRRLGRYIYIILTGEDANPQSAIAGLCAGADDYLAPSSSIDEIMARICVGQRLCEYTQDLISENEKVKLISRLEPLTGVFNRAATLEELNMAMYRAGRERIPLSTILFDVEGMHDLNERYGSRTGDRLLQEVARNMSAHIRKSDVLGRLAGDDFLLILTGVDERKARKIAGRLKRAVEDEKFSMKDIAFHVKMKAVVTYWDGVKKPEELLSHAYSALGAVRPGKAN